MFPSDSGFFEALLRLERLVVLSIKHWSLTEEETWDRRRVDSGLGCRFLFWVFSDGCKCSTGAQEPVATLTYQTLPFFVVSYYEL